MGSRRSASDSRPGYLRPPATLVGGLGLAATVAVLVLPPLSAYAPAWYLLLGLTLVCYVLLAASQSRRPPPALPRVKDPDLDTVLRLRREMAARLASAPAESYLTHGLSSLLDQLDRELIPSLATLVARRQELGRRLAEYADARRGTLRPDEATLARLHAIYQRQNQAVREVVQQVVNMDAALLGLIEEGDQARIASQVQDWAQEIQVRWQSVAEVLGAEEPGSVASGP
ncbi:MAG: hypothetical protein HY690_05540 [Chloroflexi bacterium]|nr:hypothetical protein [Chloroflexota bacterium]